jgi:hypothetical protein
MPSHTTVVTSLGLSASKTVAPLVTGTRTTETVLSFVASTDPPAIGTLQAQVIETTLLVATSSSVPAPALQIQTASQPRASTEG